MLAIGAALTLGQAASNAGGVRRSDVRLDPGEVTQDGVVPPDATLDEVLQEELPSDVAASVVDAVRGVFDPRDVRPDARYSITRGIDGLFHEFRYQVDADNLLRVFFRSHPGATAASFDAELVALPKQFALTAATADISADRPSLQASFEAAGENVELTRLVADVFSGVLDFNGDLTPGDRVQVLFERATRDGEPVGYGDVEAAVVEASRAHLIAVRYPGPDGTPAWYDERGQSLRRAFLRSPLPFAPRVTSNFSYHRVHPISGEVRPHLGVDYGAPYGTPVRAVAAGIVETAAWAGDAGRMVKLRHTGGYETAYLHLSSFAPRVSAGHPVQQGQVIGWVGESGAATGPHLDYRIIRNGEYVNPIAELTRMPAGENLPASQLADFYRKRDRALEELRQQLTAAGSAASRGLAN